MSPLSFGALRRRCRISHCAVRTKFVDSSVFSIKPAKLIINLINYFNNNNIENVYNVKLS